MIIFEEGFINERKFELSHRNISSSSSSSYEQKFDKISVKKYWDSLPYSQKEQCFSMKNGKIIGYLMNILQSIPHKPVKYLYLLSKTL